MRTTFLWGVVLLLASPPPAWGSLGVFTPEGAGARAAVQSPPEDTGSLVAKKPPRPRRGKGRKGKGAAADSAPTDTTASPEPPPVADGPALPPAPPLPTKHTAVAVLPVTGLDVTDEILAGLEQALMSEVDETTGMRAVSPADVENDVSGLGLSVASCELDTACIARCGRYARAHTAIEARVAALGGTLSLSMRLIDTESARELARVADPLADDAKERARDIHRLAVQLLRPESYVGSLAIVSSTDGADVYLDDRLVGTTPLPARLGGLPAGPHVLRVAKPGFTDLYQFVDVVYRRNSTITVDMAANTIAGVIVEVESKTGFGALYVAASEPGVEVRVDGEPWGVTPLGGALTQIAAGKRRISFRKEGLPPQSQEIEIEAGTRTELAVEIKPDGMSVVAARNAVPAAPLPAYEELASTSTVALALGSAAPPAPEGPSWRLLAGLGAAGAGLVSIGVSNYFSTQVAAKAEERDKKKAEWDPEGNPDLTVGHYEHIRRELAVINREGDQAEVYQWIFLGTGAGLAVVGGTLVLWDLVRATTSAGQNDTQTNATVLGFDVAPLPGGGRVFLSGQF